MSARVDDADHRGGAVIWRKEIDMGVYIKGMKIPNGCTECAFGKGFQYCEAMPPHFCGEVEWEMDDVKPKFCPLVEVKEPHGRLIDEDEVLDTVKRLKSFPWGDDRGNRIPLLFEPYEVERVIKQSPTVIEGSKE